LAPAYWRSGELKIEETLSSGAFSLRSTNWPWAALSHAFDHDAKTGAAAIDDADFFQNRQADPAYAQRGFGFFEQDIERFFDRRVFLDLIVKALEDSRMTVRIVPSTGRMTAL
jgi:hypothetical protein